MNIADFDEIFLKLDVHKKEYLTKEQIQAYDERLNITPLCTPQIEAAIADVCGTNSDGLVRQEHFVQVLEEIQRRRQLESQIRWDFMALDNDGSCLISVQDALLLFQSVQGKHFSMHTWNEFINSRQDPVADVYFDEIRVRLCDKTTNEPTDEGSLNQEKDRLKQLQKEAVENEFTQLQSYKGDDNNRTKSKDGYYQRLKQRARRKEYLWETKGIEALLYDEEDNEDQDIPACIMSSITITDIVDALHHKYDIIRRKLFVEMLYNHFGADAWTSMSKGEQDDALEQLEMEEKQIRQEGQLSDKSSELVGAKATTQVAPLDVLIGELPGDFNTVHSLLKQRILNMQKEGKSEKDIEKVLRKEFKSTFQGQRSDEALIALNEREVMEQDIYFKNLASNTKEHPEINHTYFHLLRQHLMAEHEESYVAAVLAVGLAEVCQDFSIPSIDPGRMRQEILAKERLLHMKAKNYLPPDPSATILPQPHSLLDLQLTVMKEMTLKHQSEQAAIFAMLQGKNAELSKASAQAMDDYEHQRCIISLRNARNNWRENITTDTRARNITILQEAVGLYWITKYHEHQRKGLDTAEKDINASVLADLQQIQDSEFHNLLNNLFKKSDKETEAILKLQQEARSYEFLDNIAAVVLGSFTWSDEEKPLIEAIELKYDNLRQLCLRHALRLEFGLGWNRIPESDKDKLLIKKRVEEKKLRMEGKLQQLSEVIEPIPKDIGTLHSLLGEDRSAYFKRVALQNHTISQPVGKGHLTKETETVELDEKTPSTESINLLADLLPRQQAEQDALIKLYRSHDEQTESEHAKWVPLALVKVEKSLAKREEWFDVGSLAVGLFERVSEALHKRHKADRERQTKLARLRFNKRLARIQAMEPYFRETDTLKPEQGDIQSWMVALVREIKKKHSNECEMFLNILQDPGMEELYDAAITMSKEEQMNRLLELRGKWFQLDMDANDFHEDNINIMEEAAAIRTVQMKSETETLGKDASIESSSVQLFVELLDKQDVEVAELVQHLGSMTEEAMKLNREHHIKCRHQEASENIIMILTKCLGTTQDEELLKVLEEKHESIVDKLLLEALIKQYGEADWLRMSELERQQKLLQLKIEARRLQQQGKENELMRLLHQSKEDQERLCKLLGDNKADFLRKLEEKRRKRKQQDGDSYEELDENEDETTKPVNILTALDERFQAEKDALLAQLKGSNNKFMNEKERQMALIQLKLEKRRIEKESHFEEAAALIGLAERQQSELILRLKNDRLRQEEIARKRLEAMRNQKKASNKQSANPTLVADVDLVSLKDIVMQRLDEKQEEERQLLMKLLNKPATKEFKRRLEAANENERQNLRNQLQTKLYNIPPSEVKTCLLLLQEACHVKLESCRQKLLHDSETAEVQPDYIHVTLLADLQDCQDQESARYVNMMKDMDEQDVIELQKKVIDEIRYQRGQCLLHVLLGTENQVKPTNGDVIVALEAKYDILREKLLQEALKRKFGEKEWQKMSEEERRNHLAELKLTERKLRQDGKLDEAAVALGLSEEDQEDQNTKRLKDLEKNFEQEKERLLNDLNQQKDQVEAEKQRQLHLVRLRREQRKAELENQFEAAALVLDLGKKHELAVEETRKKQEQLAKERLASELKRRKEKGKKIEPEQELKATDAEDKMSLIESVYEQVDKKHLKEREFLIQLLQDSSLYKKMEEMSGQNAPELSQKMEELKHQWKSWRAEEIAKSETQTAVIKEALCVHMIQLKQRFERDGKPSSYDDLQVALLADLQEIQDKATHQLLHDIENQTPFTLRHLRMSLMLAIKNEWHDNVTSMLFGPPIEASEDEMLINALQEKYNAIRDKVFTEVLAQQMGETKWNQLSAAEQHHHLTKLKQRYKHLVDEGKQEEADQLLAGIKNPNEDIGDDQGLIEKQKRYDEIVKQRQEQGLPADPAVIEQILNEQESGKKNENTKVKNVLHELDSHFEEARAKLLKQLQDHDSSLASQREKQLELLRLRREKRQLEREQNFSSAAILLSLAEQNEKARQDSVAHEIERQKALAKQRLEEMKKRRTRINQSKLEKELKTETNKLQIEQAEALLDQKDNGDLALKEAVITSVEKKHYKEREMLEQLVAESKDPSAISQSTKAAKNLGIEDTIDQLEKLHKEWNISRSQSQQAAIQLRDKMEQDKEECVKQLTQDYMKQLHHMTQALVLRMEVEKHKLKKTGKQIDNIEEEILLNLIKELHLKQEAESRATEGLIIDKEPDVLLKLKEFQQMAALGGWYDNLASVLFSVSRDDINLSQKDVIPEDQEDELNQILDKMQKQFDQERNALEEKLKSELEDGVAIDFDAEMEKLTAKQNAMKEEICESFNQKIKQGNMQKEAEQHIKQVNDYEKNAWSTLLKVLQQDDSVNEQEVKQEPGKKFKTLLQQKIAERRKRHTYDQSSVMETPSGRSSRFDHNLEPPLSRERTVIDVALTDDQKNELYEQLMQQQKALDKKLEIEHKRHEQMLKERLEKMKQRRSDEAADLLQMAERQKTTLEKHNEEEHKRQIEATKERVARLRYEKTITMREQRMENTRKFGDFLTETELSAASSKGEIGSKTLEVRFKQENLSEEKKNKSD